MTSVLDGPQLFRVAPRNFRVFDSYFDGTVTTRECEYVPFIRWPDGRWCIEANLFMDRLQEEKRSRKGKGGTLRTTAFYLSKLLRYMTSEQLTFSNLTDDSFAEFLGLLYSEQQIQKGTLREVRNRTSVRQIACGVLNFLEFVSEYRNEPAMLGKSGRIRAYRTAASASNARHSTQWVHRALASGDPVNHRFPILEEDLKAMRKVASKVASDYLRHRRLVSLSLLDETGMRRMEATLLTVGDVQNAVNQMKAGNDAASKNPELIRLLGPYSLSFTTVKHRKTIRRVVPVSAIFLQILQSHLVHRRRFLRKHFNVQRDNPNDPFLVGHQSGKALEPNTITQELRDLAVEAGITRSCSPHLVRHLYIVRLFVRFMLAHQVENTDEFKRLLVSSDRFKELVRELTGHASIDALEPYLTLASDQITNLKSTLSRVQYQSYADGLAKLNDELNDHIRNGMSPSEAFAKLSRAIEALQVPLHKGNLTSDC